MCTEPTEAECAGVCAYALSYGHTDVGGLPTAFDSLFPLGFPAWWVWAAALTLGLPGLHPSAVSSSDAGKPPPSSSSLSGIFSFEVACMCRSCALRRAAKAPVLSNVVHVGPCPFGAQCPHLLQGPAILPRPETHTDRDSILGRAKVAPGSAPAPMALVASGPARERFEVRDEPCWCGWENRQLVVVLVEPSMRTRVAGGPWARPGHRWGPGVLSPYTPRHPGTCHESAHQQEWKLYWAGWGSREVGVFITQLIS